MLTVRVLTALCLTALMTPIVQAANETCDLSWLFIDIHYRAVDAKLDTYSYGLFIGAGTSSQNQSLWPSISFNETRLASNDYCGNSSIAHCDDPAYTHGHFGADASSTFAVTGDYRSLDTDQQGQNVDAASGRDNLNLFSHFFDPSPPSKFVVEDHPVTILSNASAEQDVFFDSGSLGLGPSSTLLTQLKDIGRVGRNVFGIYLGTAYPRAGGTQNGSLVLGGYDAGRMEGAQHRYDQVAASGLNASPFKVHVKQMALVTADGSSIALLTDDGFDGYISTNQYAMDLPQVVTQQLSSALGTSDTRSPDNTLQLGSHFNGNLTITLDDSFEITYPSNWISNVSNITPFSAAGLDANSTQTAQPFIFGAAFLHHLYMTVDYDDSSFYLSNAKVYDNYVQPQSLCSNTQPAPLAKPKINNFVRAGMIGAIIGGIIGGIGITFFIMFCVRKRLQHKMSKDAINNMESGGKQPKKSSLRRRSKFGMLQLGKKRKGSKDVKFAVGKRSVSPESDAESVNGITVTVTSKDSHSAQQSYEMNTMNHDRNLAPAVVGLSPVSPVTPERSLSTQIAGTGAPLPSPAQFANPYATTPGYEPPPYSAKTPRTGNPLLGDYQREYSNYDDDDDSDIPTQHRPNHRRTHSDKLRNTMGLTVQTGALAKAGAGVGAARKKPVPLPLAVRGGQTNSTQGDKAGLGKAKGRGSGLRRMFPL